MRDTRNITMTKPITCPYLGLKQNRAIRFARTTAEHRCFVTGEAQDIPVEQSAYCLCSEYINCPLYTGSASRSTEPAIEPTQAARGGWLVGLPWRDRLIYVAIVAFILLIVGVYMVIGVQYYVTDTTAAADVPPAPLAPAAVPMATPTPRPTSVPRSPAEQPVTLYFSDASGVMLVPAERTDQQLADTDAEQLLAYLFAGPAPGTGVNSTIAADVRVRAVQRDNSSIVVNLSAPLTPQGDTALVATLAPLLANDPAGRIVVQADGTRTTLTPPAALNPDGEAPAASTSQTVTLYYPLATQPYLVPVTRSIAIAADAPATEQLVQALLRAATTERGEYAGLIATPFAAGTSLLSVRMDSTDPTTVVVAFDRGFVATEQRQLALDALVLSLTDPANATLFATPIEQVRVEIGSVPLNRYWRDTHPTATFQRPALNPTLVNPTLAE